SVPCVEQRVRDDETQSAHQEGRNRLHGVSDRQVRRTPDQIDRSERSNNLRARSVLATVVQLGECEGGRDVSQNLTPAARNRSLVERLLPAFCFLGRVALLRLQPGFLGCSARLGRASFFWNDQRSPDEIGKSFLCQLAISALAAHVARHHSNAAIARQSRGQLLAQAAPLRVVERARFEDVPENL